MTDYSELKRLAESANAYAEEDWHTPERLFIAMEKADAEFVSGCSPFSVLALIADLKKIEADRRACWAEFKVMGRHVDQLKAENEALRKVANELRRFATCEHMHHDKPDWHEYDEPCKVLARIDVVLSQGEQA